MLAFQIAFDLVDNEQSAFLQDVHSKMPKAAPAEEAPAEPKPEGEADAAAAPDAAAEAAPAEAAPTEGEPAAAAPVVEGVKDPAVVARLEQLESIISGELPLRLFLEFLCAPPGCSPPTRTLAGACAGPSGHYQRQ